MGSLSKQSRRQRAALTVLAGLVAVQSAERFFTPANMVEAVSRPRFQEIDVERINVVDAQGKRHLVISNPDLFPNPIVGGKELPRSIKPAGVVFYNSEGNEAGGMAVASRAGSKVSLIAFDYSNSEAIGFSKWESANGSWESGFSIYDKLPADADPAKGSVGESRVSIQNTDRNSQILLHDPQGRPRIRLLVDAKGNPSIEVLNEAGLVVSRMPDASAK